MSSPRFAATAIAIIAIAYAANAQASPPAPTPTPCPVTHPKGGLIGNDFLAAVLPDKFIFKPGGPGFVDYDGALGMKLGMELRKKGTLSVTGRRLDGAAEPARAYVHRSYDNYIGGMSIYLVFPTPGCWEITGTVADGKLTFVVAVEKIGAGPSGRMQGSPVTSSRELP